MTNKRILVVEDEVGIREMIVDALSLSAFTPTAVPDGFAALQFLNSGSVDLIISDINMPQIDGYELLERLRARGDQTPIIFLTARQERTDVARGLRLGADDYVTKPFGLEELLLRVEAVLRRTFGDAPRNTRLVCGEIVLDIERHETWLKGEPVNLSATEFRLLQFLMLNKDKVIHKGTLLDAVWGISFSAQTTVVETYISYLRKKLAGFEGLHTVRGIGFRLGCSE